MARHTQSLTYMHNGSPLLSIFRVLSRAASTVIPLLPITTFTPSIQPNLDLSRNLDSTYFRHRHPSDHTVLIHSFSFSKPSQYSQIHSARQLPLSTSSSTHLFIPNYPLVTLISKFSNTSSQEHSLSFSQYFS